MDEAVNQTLTIVQSVSVQKVSDQVIVQLFQPQQDVTYLAVFNRSAVNTLVIQDVYLKVTAINGGLTIPVPQAQAIVVNRRKCNMVLQAPWGVIVLPCPQLGDKQTNSGLELKIKYSTNGQPYTYIRETDLQKLSYQFWLERKKSLELRAFLINYNQSNDPITLTNWKGEVWIVNIVNSPVTLMGKARWASCGEQVETTLEFEGIKIMG